MLASGEADVWLFGGPDVAHLVPAHNGDLHFQPASVVLGQSYWLRVAVLSDRSTPVDAWLRRSTQAVAEPTSDAAAIPAWWEAPASGSYLFHPIRLDGPQNQRPRPCGACLPVRSAGPRRDGRWPLPHREKRTRLVSESHLHRARAGPGGDGQCVPCHGGPPRFPYPNVRTGTFEATDPYGSYDSDTWWRWVAPATGPAELSYADSSSDFQRTIEIVEGAAATGQIRGLASPDTVEFWATAGSEYGFAHSPRRLYPVPHLRPRRHRSPHFTEATAIDLDHPGPSKGVGRP